MTARNFFDVFKSYSDMKDFLYALCFGFFRDMERFEYLWSDVIKELGYWRDLDYDVKDGAKFTIVLYPEGDLRVKGDDTGYIGDCPGAMYCQITTVKRASKPVYRLMVKRVKED